MSLFRDGPPELIARIFQGFETFNDILCLSATNKHINSIWTAEAGTIIWPVGNAIIPSFDLALITVRATAIVVRANAEGQLPPEIDIATLEGKSSKPDVTELKAILDLAHFVSYIEFKFVMPEKIYSSWINYAEHSHQAEDEEDEQTQQYPLKTPLERAPLLVSGFRDRFHRALYRLLILGAALTRAFQEPIYNRADPQVPASLHNFLGVAIYALELQEIRGGDSILELPVNQYEVAYLSERFPAYDFAYGERWKDCFGRVGAWLIGEIAENSRRKKGELGYRDMDSSQGEILRSLLSILVIFGQLKDIGNGIHDGDEPFWSRHYPDGATGLCACLRRANERNNANSNDDEDEELLSDTDDEKDEVKDGEEIRFLDSNRSHPVRYYDPSFLQSRSTRSTQVIYLGNFETSLITLAASPSDFSHPSCIIFSHLEVNIVVAAHLPKVHGVVTALCDMLWCQSERPNTILVDGGDDDGLRKGYPTPHPPLHIFTYLLTKYFHYRFDDQAFEVGDLPRLGIYERFIRNGEIFLVDDDDRDGEKGGGGETWDGLLVSVAEECGDEKRLAYRRRGWSRDSHW